MSRGVNFTASSSSFTSTKAIRKATFRTRLISFVDKFNKFILIDADNVGSKHLQQIRLALRGRAEILMGKNSMIRNVLIGLQERYPSLEGIIPHVRGKTGLVFTDEDVGEIRSALMAIKVQKAAKVGSIAPVDVFITPGDTNLDPAKTSFFQALSISSRINKGRIAIDMKVNVLKAGDKVNPSQAVLLQMLDIKPFHYGLKVGMVFDHSEGVYNSREREETMQSILLGMKKAILKIASLSVQMDYDGGKIQAIQETAKKIIGPVHPIRHVDIHGDPPEFFKTNNNNKKKTDDDTLAPFGSIFGEEEYEEEWYPKEVEENDDEDDGQVMNLFGGEDDDDEAVEEKKSSSTNKIVEEVDEEEPMMDLFGGDDY